jgi:hypothetical protein
MPVTSVGMVIEGAELRLPNIRAPIAAEESDNIFTEG